MVRVVNARDGSRRALARHFLRFLGKDLGERGHKRCRNHEEEHDGGHQRAKDFGGGGSVHRKHLAFLMLIIHHNT